MGTSLFPSPFAGFLHLLWRRFRVHLVIDTDGARHQQHFVGHRAVLGVGQHERISIVASRARLVLQFGRLSTGLRSDRERCRNVAVNATALARPRSATEALRAKMAVLLYFKAFVASRVSNCKTGPASAALAIGLHMAEFVAGLVRDFHAPPAACEAMKPRAAHSIDVEQVFVVVFLALVLHFQIEVPRAAATAALATQVLVLNGGEKTGALLIVHVELFFALLNAHAC